MTAADIVSFSEGVGTFARCLPFPCGWDPSLPWTDLLARVAELDFQISGWQESFAVDEAVDAPFSSVRFAFWAAGPGDRLVEGSPAFLLQEVRSQRERFALALEAGSGDVELGIELHYDASLFCREEIDLMASRLLRLLESAASAPALPAGSLEILPDAERLQLLRQLDPPAALPAAKCLHALFEEWAARVPERTALVLGAQQLTYHELNARSNRLARHLLARGASPEARVAICLERSAEMVVALLAVLKAGAAYLPLDPEVPRERMASMLTDGGARLLISTGSFTDGLREGHWSRVALDTEAEAILARRDDDLHLAADPGSLAYVIFTSGSTGRPKGVAVEHRQLFQYVQAILLRLDLPEGASFATVSTLSADLGYTAVFPALASGGCLHLIAADLATDPPRLAARFAAQPVDVLKITPSHLEALLLSASGRDLLPRQRLILGGERLTWELAERIGALSPTCEVFNHYGPTESTVGVCTYRVGSRFEAEPAGTVPIGRPLAHAQIHVLAGSGLLAPLGALGEIHLGGAGLARGYLDDPVLTADRFVPDPFGPEPGGRLYRTGDRARWLPSGDLEFLGRVDDQLKIRGFRVEPGEIEAVLERHPAVARASVIGREAATGELGLAAYVMVDPGSAGPVHRLLGLRAGGRLRDQPWFDLPNGMTVAHLNEGETRFLFREIFTEQIYLRHGISLGEGACVLDVGASIGLFSLWASRLANGVRVFAFEPAPAAFQALRLNGEIHGGIQVFDFGLSREERRADLTFYPHLTLMSSLYADAGQEREVVRSFLERSQRERGEEAPRGALLEELLENRLVSETVTVSLRRLSDFLREYGIDRIDLLKIDVQKSELDVLAGIDDEDWPKIRQIALEVHDLEGRVRQVMELLDARGFEVEVEQESALAGTPLFDVYARRPEAGESEEDGPSENGEGAAAVWGAPDALIADLRRHLRTVLPDYMVPSTFSLLREFPLTPNGKLDRRALPDPAELDLGGRGISHPPTTATEKKLAEIWSSVLKGRLFGVSDSFFEIGGHSLLATQVVARIRTSFQVEVTLRDFFTDPTVAGLARRIEAAEPLAASTEERINRLVRAAYLHSRPPVD